MLNGIHGMLRLAIFSIFAILTSLLSIHSADCRIFDSPLHDVVHADDIQHHIERSKLIGTEKQHRKSRHFGFAK